MGRYIVRYVGKGIRPAADVERLRAARELTVLDETPRLLLVEATAERLQEVLGSVPGWTWSPERSIRLDDPRPKPRRGPEG